MHKHISILSQAPLPSRLPQNIEQSSLCYAVGPCWLSILNISVYMSIPNSLTIPSSQTPHPRQELCFFVLFCFWLCPMACGTLVLGPGIEPTPAALEGRILTTGPPGRFLMPLIFIPFYSLLPHHLPKDLFFPSQTPFSSH